MSTDLDALIYRISHLESRFNELEPAAETVVQNDPVLPSPVTVLASLVTFITPAILTIIDDNTWRSLTVAGVPSNAKALILYIEFNNSTGSGTFKNLEVRVASGSDEYKVAGSASGAGSDTTAAGIQSIAPVPGTFEYRSPSGWLTLVECHGYIADTA
jgi:hypothetical protein